MSSEKMLTVFKYDLPITSSPAEVAPIRLPAGAKILKVAEQGFDPINGPRFFVWALVDPEEKLQELRYCVTVGTGHRFPLTTLSERDWDHRETVLAAGGALLVHVWISRPTGTSAKQVSADNA